MTPQSPDYSVLDRPEVLAAIFHPRPHWGDFASDDSTTRLLIPVDDDVHIGAAFHMAAPHGVNLLFFHGNGEIVSDYDDLGPLYNQQGMNFMVADYRGYGVSSGDPGVAAMMADCHKIMDFATAWLKSNGYGGPLIIMGRSLGSASALELASTRSGEIDGLIVESGFAYAAPLLRLLGVDVAGIGFDESRGFGNIDKVRQFDSPTLIIHAEYDHIIPYSDGQALYDAAGAADKWMLTLKGANHNDIFIRGLSEYMSAVKALAETIIAASAD